MNESDRPAARPTGAVPNPAPAPMAEGDAFLDTPPVFEESEPEPEKLNELERLTGVFFSPGRAFADIARRPRWWIPIIISAVFSTLFINAVSRRVGWEAAFRDTMTRNPFAQNMSPQQLERTVQAQARVAEYLAYATPVTSAIAVLFVALILMFLCDTILGADIGLKRMMGVVSYAYLAYVPYTLLATLVVFLKDPRDFDLQNPLAFNVGAFLPEDAPGWLLGLGTSLDLFSIWIVILLAIGIAAASRKMKFGKALGVVMLPWSLLVLARMALGAISG